MDSSRFTGDKKLPMRTFLAKWERNMVWQGLD
jgi:hypothetical protein